MIDRETRDAAEKLLELLRARGLMIVTAESCTGGLVAAALTEIPRSSDVVDRGFITYSNAAKETMLGVASDILERFGAVSEQTARAMAEGALRKSGADVAVSVTGVAGPSGGSAEKPVGLVHFGAARKNGPIIHREMRFGDLGRSEIRRRSVLTALALVEELLAKP
ncbi:MAG: CinA family protein [Bradyrhizobiaceae bacterium]|nr:CinA family protein [Bradyrhizobiaceae bacterium]